jgi:hypothetical protein
MADNDLYRWQNLRKSVGLPEPVVTERCSYCRFVIEALVEEARAAFAEHACDRPRPGVSKLHKRGRAALTPSPPSVSATETAEGE